MIKRLRLKFVMINMTIVTMMLCAILGLVFYFTRENLETESVGMLHNIGRKSLSPGAARCAGGCAPTIFCSAAWSQR